MSGQNERPIVIAAPGDRSLALEGIFVSGEGDGAAGAVIAPPHPLYGGSLESPVVAEVAHACARAGIATKVPPTTTLPSQCGFDHRLRPRRWLSWAASVGGASQHN